MFDPRQGPLLIRNDPLATAAERCTVTQPDDRAAVLRFLSLDPATRPTLTAFAGYDDPFGRRYFYMSPTGWRDTLSDAKWEPRQ